MKYTQLGKTELEVSQVSFGTSPLGGLFGSMDLDEGKAAVREAVEMGINLFDSSPYYGAAEEHLGDALQGLRDRVYVATKTGRFGDDDFDYSPARIRKSIERSLRLLKTDYLDLFQLHDVEHVPLGPVFEDSFAELMRLKDEGLCRYIGVTGYPLAMLRRAVQELEPDVVLSYAHFTLMDQSLATELAPIAREHGVGVINAAAVGLGLLTRGGSKIPSGHPSSTEVQEVARRMSDLCEARGADIGFLANQFAIQRSGCATTIIGTTKRLNVRIAVNAVEAPIDEELLSQVLTLSGEVEAPGWQVGLPENN